MRVIHITVKTEGTQGLRIISDDVGDSSRNDVVDLKLEALSRLTAHGCRAL